MWGLGLVMLCMLTFVIIGVISNVTLTNQQDYYGVKQTSEAAVYDSKEIVQYKRGICICAKGSAQKSPGGTYKFTNKDQYTIMSPEDEECNHDSEKCEIRIGEYVIDPDIFTESVIARLGSIIKPSEVYDIKVQEVIPYPPKISVYISYHQALNNGGDAINAEIPNQIDAVIEDAGSQAVLKYQHNDLPNLIPTCGQPQSTTEEPDNPQEEPEQPSQPSQPVNQYDNNQCFQHYHCTHVACSNHTGTYSCHKDGSGTASPSKPSPSLCSDKCPVGYSPESMEGCTLKKYYTVYYKGTTQVACPKGEFDDAGSAKAACGNCGGRACVARCSSN